MSTPYFDAFLGPRTTRRCPSCNNARPLHEFRRWAGKQRVLHEVCNICIPEKRLSEMTPQQRIDALDTDRLSVKGLRPTVVANMNAKELHYRRSRLRTSALKRHGHERRSHWSAALFARLRYEMEWCRRASTSLRAQRSPAWAEFLGAYLRVLKEFNRLALIRYRRRSAPLKPTMEDIDPTTYIFPETISKLHQLFAACGDDPLVRGKRLKTPWFIDWKKE